MLKSKLSSGLSTTSALVTANLLFFTIVASATWAGEVTTTRTNPDGYSVTKTRSRDDGQWTRSQTWTNPDGYSVTKTRSRDDGQWTRSQTRTNPDGYSVTKTRYWTR